MRLISRRHPAPIRSVHWTADVTTEETVEVAFDLTQESARAPAQVDNSTPVTATVTITVHLYGP